MPAPPTYLAGRRASLGGQGGWRGPAGLAPRLPPPLTSAPPQVSLSALVGEPRCDPAARVEAHEI